MLITLIYYDARAVSARRWRVTRAGVTVRRARFDVAARESLRAKDAISMTARGRAIAAFTQRRRYARRVLITRRGAFTPAPNIRIE